MNGARLTAVSVAGAAATAAFAAQPGTLNFQDVTVQRINQTFGEMVNNEKEVEVGDFDNDDDLDVVIANAHSDFGQRNNKLYRNDGGVFNEISGAPAIPGFAGTDVSRNAFFRDYDLDGWLDIIIVNDANTAGDGGRSKIYMNQHPGGVFGSFTEEGLVRLGPSTGGAACGAVSIDPDMDGDWDLYVGNYPGPSQDTMYFNNAIQNPGDPGIFTAMTGTHVPVDGDYTVDVAAADMNGDGQIDLLISNGFNDGNFVYYNDNQAAGSGLGDYQYTGSTQGFGISSSENAKEPGDFDNDNDMDFYWSNRSGVADQVYVNQGNDANNKAVFSAITNLPDSVRLITSRKATVADLNDDGRLDVFVMKEAGASSRPTVLRNTTVNGQISFVDWTPALAFPIGSNQMGWHAAIFDTNGDGDLDIFLGGWTNDHLLEQVAGSEYNEGALSGAGVIPFVYNGRPTAVVGSIGEGESDTFLINGLATTAFVSVVLNGADDYLLEVLDGSDVVLETIDRGGLGVEEATQYDPASMPATVKLRVTGLACASPYHIAGDCGVGVDDFLYLLASWGPNPGHPADFDLDDDVDVDDFLTLLANWGTSTYVLDVLARDG